MPDLNYGFMVLSDNLKPEPKTLALKNELKQVKVILTTLIFCFHDHNICLQNFNRQEKISSI